MKSDLPNSSQFSPVQTPLPALLSIVREHQPNRSNVTHGIAQSFFAGRIDAQKLANNTVLALSEYGVLNKPTDDQTIAHLTELGQSLAITAEHGKSDDLYAAFARHILLNLHGLDLLTCANDIAVAGQQPTKALIVKELRARGIYHPPNGTHANGMRQWLEQAGLVEKDKWIAKPEQGHSEVWVCGWDRPRLLERIAGAFLSAQVNILSADIFTRGDNLALDIFRVCSTQFAPVTNVKDIARVETRLSDSLAVEDYDFTPLLSKDARLRSYRMSQDAELPTKITICFSEFVFNQRVSSFPHNGVATTFIEIVKEK